MVEKWYILNQVVFFLGKIFFYLPFQKDLMTQEVRGGYNFWEIFEGGTLFIAAAPP